MTGTRVLSVGLAAVTLGALGTGVWWYSAARSTSARGACFTSTSRSACWSRHCCWCISARGSLVATRRTVRSPGRSPVRWLGDRGGTPMASSEACLMRQLPGARAEIVYNQLEEEGILDDGNRLVFHAGRRLPGPGRRGRLVAVGRRPGRPRGKLRRWRPLAGRDRIGGA